MQQNSITTKFLLQYSIAMDFIIGNKKFSVAIDLKIIDKKISLQQGFFFLATKPPNALLKNFYYGNLLQQKISLQQIVATIFFVVIK